MLLVRLLHERPCELRADLQQHYGLNLDGMGVDYTYAHAACCAAQLPAGARVWRGTSAEWGTMEYLLANMEHVLRVIAWQGTEDAQHGRNYPEPLPTPADRERERARYERSMANRAWIDSILGGEHGRRDSVSVPDHLPEA